MAYRLLGLRLPILQFNKMDFKDSSAAFVRLCKFRYVPNQKLSAKN